MLPKCEECGKLIEDLGNGDIYCEECCFKFFEKLKNLLGPDGMAEVLFMCKQNKRLGIGLEIKPQ